MFVDNLTYEKATANADALKSLGQTVIYLSRGGKFPWHLATACEPGGSHRFEISTDARFSGKDPETGLTFNWNFDIEPLSANGSGQYQIDTEACINVIKKIKGSALTDFRKYLSDCTSKVKARGDEYQKAADSQYRDAAILRDLVNTGQ